MHFSWEYHNNSPVGGSQAAKNQAEWQQRQGWMQEWMPFRAATKNKYKINLFSRFNKEGYIL